jgi:two-component system response regulator HydG
MPPADSRRPAVTPQSPPRGRPAPPELIGSSELFRAFRERLAQVAATEVTVLVSGESGSGKGLAARALHAASPRRDGPFVAVNLAAVPAQLVESELFGHERGAFTGAERARRGCFRRAEGGTLLLEDVDLLPGDAQVKLLRVLQERQVEPLGAEGPADVDVRVVATTGVDLRLRVQEDAFREDLYYRLAVVPLEVPPLRSHLEDLPELALALAERAARRVGQPVRPLSPDALERLRRHPWPGNVRELENALERVSVLPPAPAADGAPAPVSPEELGFLDESTDGVADELAARALAHGIDPETLTRAMMSRALEEHRGNVSAAARAVGLTRRAFEYRLERSRNDAS